MVQWFFRIRSEYDTENNMYEHFAHMYDEFMQNIPAEEWAGYAEQLWQKHGLDPKLVLDLCCGTGSLALELSSRGYDMIGVDSSPEMLQVARDKALEEGREEEILFLLQDMREFELYGTVDSILCTCDSLNYLLEEDDVRQVFKLAENYLDQGGLFLFDLNTEYKYRELLGDGTFADTAEDAAFIWENYYYEEEKINEYQVTFFEEDPSMPGTYRRSEETHYQRAYSVEEITGWLEEAHFTVEGVYDAFTLEAPGPWSERITFVAREQREKQRYEPEEEKDE